MRRILCRLQLHSNSAVCSCVEILYQKMSSKGKIERWLLADWNGGRLLKSSSMIRVTEEVNLGNTDTNHRTEISKPDIASDGGTSFEGQKILKAIENNNSGALGEVQNEGLDYSPSASSWEPSGDESSSDSPSEYSFKSEKNSFTKQYINKSINGRGPKPIHRPNAVTTNMLKTRLLNGKSSSSSLKRTHKDSLKPISIKKYSADSTKRNHTPPIELTENRQKTTELNVQAIQEIKNGFQELFAMLNQLKPQSKMFFMDSSPAMDAPATNNTSNTIFEDYDETSVRSESEDSDRSDDNVLISNKYHRVAQDLIPKETQKKCKNDEEWVPIGSGKTMIHKDKYRKVNWKSYTIATRTLLLAAFPRRILATHSLTGKRSPAFRNKPAKMCLDPKIVSDIVLEITSRFKVKENLVRSIITTKCADESKMLKTRLQSKKKSMKNDENVQPTNKENQK